MTEQNKTTTIPLPVQGKDIDSNKQSKESAEEELFTCKRYNEFLTTNKKMGTSYCEQEAPIIEKVLLYPVNK